MSAAPSLDRLLATRGDAQRACAQALVREGLSWPDWQTRFNQVIVQEPKRLADATHALERAAIRHKDDYAVARLRLMRGVALQRSGSPKEASRLLLDVEAPLRAHGEHERALQSLLLAVDALAHAGDLAGALSCAERAAPLIRGPRAGLLRAILAANRANVLRLAGQLEASAEVSDRAARGLKRAGHTPSAAAARLNAGVAHLYAGRLPQAKRRFEAARAVFEDAGQHDRVFDADYNLACLDVRRGAVGRAIPALEALAQRAADAGMPRREALCHMDLADALRRASDYRAAMAQARKAVAAFERADARAEALEARWQGAQARASLEPEAAKLELRALAADARGAGRREVALRAQALALALGGTASDSVRTASALEHEAQQLGLAELLGELRLLRVQRLLAKRRWARAERTLAALPRTVGQHPWLALRREQLRAELDLGRGDIAKCLRRLRSVTRTMHAFRAGLPGPWLRTTFALHHADPHLVLVDVLLERGEPRDRREAQATLNQLALDRFLAGRTPTALGPEVAQLRARLEALYARLAASQGQMRGVVAAERSAWVRDVRELQHAVAKRWRERERREPAVPPATPMHAEARPLARLSVWQRGGDVRALLDTAGQVHDLGALCTRSWLQRRHQELAFHAHRTRLGRGSAAQDAFERTRTRISRVVLAPLASLPPQSHLRLVVASELPDLPWEILHLGGRPLAAALNFARVPAAGLATPRTARGRGTSAILSGETGLPALSREAAHFAHQGELLRGDTATRGAVARALRTASVVHMAMHGLSLPEAPALGGVRVADGWFTAADVPARIGARLVSLAACQTGTPRGTAGQAWGALPDALLRAGADWVVWTAGDVDDATTADLMAAFHPALPNDALPLRFGRALEQVEREQGSAARLAAFRLTGGRA